MINKKVKIRPLQEQDLDTIVILDRLTLYGIWNLAQYQREFALPNSNFYLLCLSDVALTGEQVIGMGCWRKIASDAEIPLFAIHPDYQAQGWGKFFFLQLLRDIVNHNLLYARLEVRVSNQKAIAFYQKFGFQIISRLNNYYRHEPLNQEDAYRMISPPLKSQLFKQRLDFWLNCQSDILNYVAQEISLSSNQNHD